MRVISGPFGRKRVQSVASTADRIAGDMQRLLAWVEVPLLDPVLVAAQALLWFVTIHPCDDGNGSIARALADLALARSEQSAH